MAGTDRGRRLRERGWVDVGGRGGAGDDEDGTTFATWSPLTWPPLEIAMVSVTVLFAKLVFTAAIV